jgi:hypothetical protein
MPMTAIAARQMNVTDPEWLASQAMSMQFACRTHGPDVKLVRHLT